MLNFGELESPYGKIKKDKDIIVLKTKNKDFYLKRIYG